MKVAVEYMKHQKIRNHEFGRVPNMGEQIEVEDRVWTVRTVIHIADTGQGEPVAYLRVED
jgi:hypothetical protein